MARSWNRSSSKDEMKRGRMPPPVGGRSLAIRTGQVARVSVRGKARQGSIAISQSQRKGPACLGLYINHVNL